MHFVIFGLTVSSSWGNGHATIWRGLCGALKKRGHRIAFFEKDVPYYAAHRDLYEIPGGDLILYPSWEEAVPLAKKMLPGAEVAMVTSYCPDGIAATDLVLETRTGLRVFYDLDTPVTLEMLKEGKELTYIGKRGLRDFDLVLSYTGGDSLQELKSQLGAKRVETLYGSVDPSVHQPVPVATDGLADLSYLGTYALDRQEALERLFVEPACRRDDLKFVLGGSLYPDDFPWRKNIFYYRHVPPPDHPRFYCSSKLTLSVTRQAMARTGYCPSGRLFEASACRVPILSDFWPGLECFFEPGREILIANTTEEAMDALMLPPERLIRVGRAARVRTLEMHTAECRARELERVLWSC